MPCSWPSVISTGSQLECFITTPLPLFPIFGRTAERPGRQLSPCQFGASFPTIFFLARACKAERTGSQHIRAQATWILGASGWKEPASPAGTLHPDQGARSSRITQKSVLLIGSLEDSGGVRRPLIVVEKLCAFLGCTWDSSPWETLKYSGNLKLPELMSGCLPFSLPGTDSCVANQGMEVSGCTKEGVLEELTFPCFLAQNQQDEFD